MANRLQHALSPYLQQHRDNPVDWWEWGDDAFADAARRDVPVLLSVGYAACHWCHVMAHESFEDATTAREMNEGFVCVKVDREERPDVDAVYMDATQALTGQGGWPMTVFLTPDGRPFYAGTYFPPQPLHGRPSFRQVLVAVGEAWRDRRDEAVRAAGSIAEALAGRNLPQAVPASGGRRPVARRPRARGAGGPRARRLRRRAEVPAVRGPGLAVAARRHRRRDGVAGNGARGAHPGGDGPLRHVRPADRRLRPVRRRRRLGGAALREDALRQRPAGPRVPALVAAHRLGDGRPDRARDLRLDGGGTRHAGGRLRLGARRGHRGRRGATYVWTPEQLATCWGRTTAAGRPTCSAWCPAAPSSTAPRPCGPARPLVGPERRTATATGGSAARPAPRRAGGTAAARAGRQGGAAWNGLAVAALAETGACSAVPTWSRRRSAAPLLVAVHLDDHGRLAPCLPRRHAARRCGARGPRRRRGRAISRWPR